MLRKLKRTCRLTPMGSHPPRLVIAFTLMVMLGNLIAPIASTIEAAPQNSTQSDQQANANDLNNQPLEPLDPTDDQPTDEDQNGDQDQSEDQDSEPAQAPETSPASIQVNLYWCDESVDLANAPTDDYSMGETLKSQCTAQASPVTVAVSSNTGSAQQMASAVYSFPGTTDFSPLFADDWTISILPQVVVTSDLFNCNGLTPYGNTKPYSTYARLSSTAPDYGIDTLDEETIVCDWFGQIPDTSSLNITKWNCPEGFDFQGQGYEVAKGTCWEEVNPPVEFTVTNVEANSTFTETRPTDHSNNDEVFFPEIPEGSIEVSEIVPQGYLLTAAYCRVNAGAASNVTLARADMFALTANGGDAIRCDVFDTPGMAPNTQANSVDGVSVSIQKYICWADVESTSTDVTYYQDLCVDRADAIFNVNHTSHPTADGVIQEVGLVPEANGTIPIQENLIEGNRTPVVFCTLVGSDSVERMDVENNGILLQTTDPNDEFRCLWYNMASNDSGHVIAEAYICDEAQIYGEPADKSFYPRCSNGQPGATFTLGTTPEPITATASGSSYGVGFPDIPNGTYDLTITAPEGFTVVSYECGAGNWFKQGYVEGAEITIWKSQSVVPYTISSDTTVSITMMEGYNTTCYWYVLPTSAMSPGTLDTPSDGGLTLSLVKYVCPAEVDATQTSYEYFQNLCQDTVEVGFYVNDELYSSIDGLLQAPDLTVRDDGTISVIEIIPPGYSSPVVFCTLPGTDGPTQLQVVDGGVTMTPDAETELIRCSWFNIPVPDDTGDVYIYKFACTTDAPTDADITWFAANCDMRRDGVTFVLNRPDPDADIQTNTGDRGTGWEGIAAMEGVEPGTYPLSETSDPHGYTLRAAYCATVDRGAGDPTGGWQTAALSGTTINVTVESGRSTYCIFFNAPITEAYGAVKITKWDCGTAFITDSNADPNDAHWLADNCTTPQNGVEFDLDGFPLTTNNGYVQWVGVTPGTYTLTEHVPDGYAPVAVVCTSVADNAEIGNIIEAGATTPVDGAISVTVDANFTTECNWYNMPSGSGEIQIKKWDCGDAVLPQKAGYSWFQENCTTKQDGVTFTINTTPAMSVTTVDGMTTIADVPVGSYQLSEQIPDGYGRPAVACTLVSKDVPVENLTFALVPKSNGTDNAVDIQMLADHIVYCNWYNMPGTGTTGDGTGEIQIKKWDCGEAVLPQKAGNSWFQENCTTPQDGVTFSVNTDPAKSATTVNGMATIADVPEGNYQLSETIPDGYSRPAVACTLVSKDVPVENLTFALMPKSVSTDNAVDIQMLADHVVYCNWYNIPTAHGNVSVTKWECPEGATIQDATTQWLQDNCMTRVPGVNFTLTTYGSTETVTTDANGDATFTATNVSAGILEESIPAGYSPTPVFICSGAIVSSVSDLTLVTAPGGAITINRTSNGEEGIHCDVYNFVEPPSTVVIYKWSCPEGVEPQPTAQWYQDNCSTPLDGVVFTLTDVTGARSAMTAAGSVTFNDVTTGPVQISETTPAGYSNQPFLVCQITQDGNAGDPFTPITVNGILNTSIEKAGVTIRCDWYNVPVGPGEITIYKWTCPEGYDRSAWGADPMTDCTHATNGVTFWLTQPAPMPGLQSDTGDSIPGAVYFGGLEPGTYLLDEMLAPDQAVAMKDIFVWQCFGLTSSSVQPVPLNSGSRFEFTITGGDHIVCHWFNVPKPAHGSLTVTKFNCTTEKYIADVYCYTNQTGQEFNLQLWNGSAWSTIASGKTDVNGKLSFPNLDAGDYRLVEPDTQACLMKSSNITPNKNIGVKTGEETIVYVYNCKTPPPPTKTPTKYPNTGVDPSASGQQEQRTPGVELAGLVALAGISLNRRRTDTPAA